MKTATAGLPSAFAEKLQGSVAFTQMDKPAQLPPNVDWHKLVLDGLNAFHLGVASALTIGGWVAIGGSIIVFLLAPRKMSK